MRLKIYLHVPTIPFLGTYPREMKTCSRKDLYANVPSNIIHNSQTWIQLK